MEKKREEVRRLKTLKMKDIRAKLDKIGKEAGKDILDDAGQSHLFCGVLTSCSFFDIGSSPRTRP